MFVIAHPLNPNRLADRARKQRGIFRHIIGAHSPVTTRGLSVEHSNIFFGKIEQLGNGLARFERTLRAGIDCRAVLADIRDRAGWADHAVELERPAISRFIFLACFGQRRFRIALVDGHLIAQALGVFQNRKNFFRTRRHFSRGLRPRDFERLGGVDGGPLARGDDADKASLLHDFDNAGDILD